MKTHVRDYYILQIHHKSYHYIMFLEMQVEEENEGFKDPATSDFVLPRVTEAHLESGEGVLQERVLNLPDRITFVEEYLANLQETYSITTEATDSGLSSQSAPSDSGFNKDIGNIVYNLIYLLY